MNPPPLPLLSLAFSSISDHHKESVLEAMENATSKQVLWILTFKIVVLKNGFQDTILLSFRHVWVL